MSLKSDINHSLSRILKTCADLIVKDIMRKVVTRQKITEGPQKRNAPSTIRKKGHDWQLRGKKDTFLKKNTYVIVIEPNGTGGRIYFDYPAPDGGNVGVYVTRKGYKFYGVSEKAQRDCRQILRGWLRGSVVPMVRRELRRGLRNTG
jgi:hypothetical protein